MENCSESRFNMSPEELVALASSLSISLSQTFCKEDLETLKCFFATLASNIGLIQRQCKHLDNNKKSV